MAVTKKFKILKEILSCKKYLKGLIHIVGNSPKMSYLNVSIWAFFTHLRICWAVHWWIFRTPVGLEDVSKYPALFASLLTSGAWSLDDLKKLAGLNFIRVFREVEKVCNVLQLLSTVFSVFFWYMIYHYYILLAFNTMFKNQSKCRIWILAFLAIFCPI